ncbi:hypothetical protein ACFL0F_01710 [Patescibacteria group bacterium]
MNIEHETAVLTEFQFDEGIKGVVFIETISVVDGVTRDIYSVEDDTSIDLGIIKIKPGSKTPRQRVKNGQKTIEGYISGRGIFTITREKSGKSEIHPVDDNINRFSIDVGIGDVTQWLADENSNLVAFEVCIPPYDEGRFENIS